MTAMPVDLSFFRVHTPLENLEYSIPSDADTTAQEIKNTSAHAVGH